MTPALGPRREIVPLRAVIPLKTVMADSKGAGPRMGDTLSFPGPGSRVLWGQVARTGLKESVTVGLGGSTNASLLPHLWGDHTSQSAQ